MFFGFLRCFRSLEKMFDISYSPYSLCDLLFLDRLFEFAAKFKRKPETLRGFSVKFESSAIETPTASTC